MRWIGSLRRLSGDTDAARMGQQQLIAMAAPAVRVISAADIPW
jgi:hypothetical protein